MRPNKNFGFAAAALLQTGFLVSAHAAPQAQPPGSSAVAQMSQYDPYTTGWGPCAQGAPYGGPKCIKLLPPTGTHTRIG
jgi:hypothetical protein